MANSLHRIALSAAWMLGILWSGATHAGAELSVTVEPAGEPGEFLAAASVRDPDTNQVIAPPSLRVIAGKSANFTIEAAEPDASTVRFEVSVDSTATRARWRLEWRRGGRLEASAESTVTLAAAAETGY
jgi:hypothetical protein